MSLAQFILSLVGTLIGGLLTLIGIWTKNRLDEREKTQTWLEGLYLFGAVEPLLTAMQTIETHLAYNVPHTKEAPIELNRETMNKIGRVGQILQSDVYRRLQTAAIYHLETFKQHDTEADRRLARSLAHGLAVALNDLRQVLLEYRIARKTDVLKLASTEAVKPIIRGLEEGEREYERILASASP
jgi:hypothetical protein